LVFRVQGLCSFRRPSSFLLRCSLLSSFLLPSSSFCPFVFYPRLFVWLRKSAGTSYKRRTSSHERYTWEELSQALKKVLLCSSLLLLLLRSTLFSLPFCFPLLLSAEVSFP